MQSRAEITFRYAKAYVKAGKKDKGRILDEVVSVTGWSRDNARGRLCAAARQPPGVGQQVATRVHKPRSLKFSSNAVKVLQRVWAGWSIDRYLQGAKATDQIRGVSTTKPSSLPRSAIAIRRAGDEVKAEPGFFEGDTLAHCGPTLKGRFARTLNLTDVHTGWVFTPTVRNNAHVHILGALKTGVQEIPFEVTGLNFDNGTEFLNKAVIAQAAGLEISFTRSRPDKKNDQATIESKNNHLVRKYRFYYRYDTSAERTVLNRLWKLVNDRFNYLTPTKKPVEFDTDRFGRRTRIYDKPATPLDRLLAAKVLSPTQAADLVAYRESLNPAAIGRQIADQLYLASLHTALPDIRTGIQIEAN